MAHIENLCSVMGIKSSYDPDHTYELTTDNVEKILAIHTRFRLVFFIVYWVFFSLLFISHKAPNLLFFFHHLIHIIIMANLTFSKDNNKLYNYTFSVFLFVQLQYFFALTLKDNL